VIHINFDSALPLLKALLLSLSHVSFLCIPKVTSIGLGKLFFLWATRNIRKSLMGRIQPKKNIH